MPAVFFRPIYGQLRLLKPDIFGIKVRAFLTYLSKHRIQMSYYLLVLEIHLPITRFEAVSFKAGT